MAGAVLHIGSSFQFQVNPEHKSPAIRDNRGSVHFDSGDDNWGNIPDDKVWVEESGSSGRRGVQHREFRVDIFEQSVRINVPPQFTRNSTASKDHILDKFFHPQRVFDFWLYLAHHPLNSVPGVRTVTELTQLLQPEL